MRNPLRLVPGLSIVGCLILSGSVQAQVIPPPYKAKEEHPIYSSLREVILHGNNLFNTNADYAGCYHVFQGALIAIRPYLEADNPKLRAFVDTKLQDAERLPKMVDRAFALRKVLDSVRDFYRPEGVKPSGPGTTPDKKGPEKIDQPKTKTKEGDKTDDKKPADKKDSADDKKGDKADGELIGPPKKIGVTGFSKIYLTSSAAAEPALRQLPDDAVALIHGDVAITREEFGEYLIARVGADRIDAQVNRRIIELACREKNIFVSDAEVEAQFAADLKSLGVVDITEKAFADTILKRLNRTVFEWKEDVIRPRLALAKLAKLTIKVDDDEVRKAFETRYGPKVECRMIVMRSADKASWNKVYLEIVTSEEAFARTAASETQCIELLRSTGGKVPAIHKHFGDSKIENAVLALKAGEVSPPIEMPDGTAVIIKCDARIAANDGVTFETERAALTKEVLEQKVAKRIPEVMQELRRQAAPVILLKKS